MKKNKLIAVVFIVCFLVLVAAIVYLITNKAKNDVGPIETSTPSDQGIYIVDAPNSSYNNIQDENLPDGTYIVDAPQNIYQQDGVYVVNPPQEAQSQGGIYIVETPGPSGKPIPSSAPVPSGTTIASGSFSSSTGTKLNLYTSYNAVITGPDTVSVYVSVSLNHASLSSNSRNVSIRLGGQSANITAPSINYQGGGTTTQLGSHTFTINLSSGQSSTLYLSSGWAFNGTYSGVNIGLIECGGNISLSR